MADSATSIANYATARAHIALLSGDAGTPIRVRLLHDTIKSKPAVKLLGPIEKLWPQISAAQREGYGAFVVANGGGDSDTEISDIRACFVDADNVPLPSSWHLNPDFIVQRDATHWHAYWRAFDLPVEQFKALQRRLADHYGTDPTVCNPSRVMRLAGTAHQKGPAVPIALVDMTGGDAPCLLGHSADAITAGLPELAPPPPPATNSANGLPVTPEIVDAMLRCIPPSCDRNQWLTVCGAMGSAPVGETKWDGLDLFTRWSRGDLHGGDVPRGFAGEDDCENEWRRDQQQRADGATVPAFGALVNLAREHGYTGPSHSQSVVEVFAHIAAQAASAKSGPVSFADVLAREVPPVQEIIAGLVEKGTVTFLSAPGGSHKSRLAVQWGLSIDCGNPVFGRAVERSRFVYVSYEDHADEVARRAQSIARRLSLDTNSAGQFWDLSGKDEPLAVVLESGQCELRPFWNALHSLLTGYSGHKFVVLDSTYNALRFAGSAKINEGAVMAGIALLQRLCDECDCTLLVLWHPSQAGQERGDSSGWSVAWHNAPRARLSLAPVKDTEGAFDLKVEKRNHGPKGKPLTLHWSDGVLLPYTETDTAERRAHLVDACVRVAILAAEQGAPIQKQRRLNVWMVDEIERAVGRRPTDREIKEELARGLSLGQLRYVNGTQKRVAGYYPADLDKASALASAAKRREKEDASA